MNIGEELAMNNALNAYGNPVYDAKKASVCKVFSVKDANHHYYVQEMPGFWGMGRDFVVMKDRRRLYAKRWKDPKSAISWLLSYLLRELGQPELDL